MEQPLLVTDRLDALVLARNRIGCRGAARLASTMQQAGARLRPGQRAAPRRRRGACCRPLSRPRRVTSLLAAAAAALPAGLSCALRQLDLSHNRVADAGAAALSSALAGGAESPVPLQQLELEGNQVRCWRRGVGREREHVQHLQQRQHLRLPHQAPGAWSQRRAGGACATFPSPAAQVGDVGGMALAHAAKGALMLQRLNASHNDFSAPALASLAEALRINHGGAPGDARCARCAARDAAPRVAQLQLQLRLEAAGRCRPPRPAARPARPPAVPGTLRELLVAGSHSGEDAAVALLAAAAATRELRLLDVRGVPLGQQGASAAALLIRWVLAGRRGSDLHALGGQRRCAIQFCPPRA